MTAGPPAVTASLARLERALRDAGHPLAGMLQPGLPEPRVRDAVAATGLRLPDEAVALWSWRDGVRPAATADPGRTPGSEFLPGGCLFLPLDDAVAFFRQHLATFPWDDLDDHDRTWFPLARYGHGDTIWVECAGEEHGPAPLVRTLLGDYNEPGTLADRRVASVADGLDVWTAWLERGIWGLREGSWQMTRDRDADLPTAWP